ncbi:MULTISPECIES: hypothetical protein [Gammaproteobacteria]|uniref:hypothetical protein n=1 Tax=Gammaproteobacteria TaxID=1236 RepID=UPI000DD090A3|nr:MULTISPECIES: hypothetical protein [Gammaproteobacteria]RTE87745.1 hypothetical protein DQX04_05095 [Aliidiomarina sp. B3213]TCZ92473.1 hypothetical protein EYQ95_00200 [Lysobacter sp. N42]
MTGKYYPFRSKTKRSGDREKTEAPLAYFEKALAALQANPEKVKTLKANLAHYEKQQFLPKSAKVALKRYSYLLALTNSVDEITKWVLQDSYEGQRFRQFPLIFKGVINDEFESGSQLPTKDEK